MKRALPFEPELEALIKPGKIERRAPPEMRARALARGRASVEAGGRLPPNASLELLAPPPKRARNTPAGELGGSELELLARAQASYTHRDFTRAIALLSELTRQFPNGQLAEAREALRVRALLGAGRMDEGQRAAAAFANRAREVSFQSSIHERV